MKMASYLAQIEHAAKSTLQVIWSEHTEIASAEVKLRGLRAATEDGYRRAASFMEEENADDFMQGVGNYWGTYFGSDKDRHRAEDELTILMGVLQTREFSRAAMAAALIQYAKQGIAIVHGDLARAPSGRDISGVSLSNVIWMARNQGLHWEDGSFSSKVTSCFEQLKVAHPELANYARKSVAFEVVKLLNWSDHASFERDMASLG